MVRQGIIVFGSHHGTRGCKAQGIWMKPSGTNSRVTATPRFQLAGFGGPWGETPKGPAVSIGRRSTLIFWKDGVSRMKYRRTIFSTDKQKFEIWDLWQRGEILRGLTAQLSLRSIARVLKRSVSTISREVRRKGGSGQYHATILCAVITTDTPISEALIPEDLRSPPLFPNGKCYPANVLFTSGRVHQL